MNGECAIVTGGARGIGRAIALKLAGEGFSIVVNYAHSEDAAAALVSEIEAMGVSALAVKADIASYAKAAELVDIAAQKFGGIYALINNAGITRDALIMRMTEAHFDEVIATNLKGAFNCMRHASAIMMRKRRGRIVNIASVAGVMGNVGQANYAASKAGLIGMTKSVARELAPRSITVNAVAPGLVETEMTGTMNVGAMEKLMSQVPLGRMGTAQEVADLVAFLCSESAGYITGQVMCIDGGLAM